MWSDKMLLSVRCHKPQQQTDFETNTKNPTDFFLLSLRDETGDFTVVLIKGGNQIRLQLPETERRGITEADCLLCFFQGYRCIYIPFHAKLIDYFSEAL